VALAAGALLWLVWALSAAYLLVLTIGAVSQARKVRRQGSAMPRAGGGQVRRIGVLIPAHNEELLLGGVLDRLHTLDYPRDRFRLFVIADNCSDETARVAREHGAEVMERTDAELRGKGYALEWALERLLSDSPGASGFDAFLILDADSYLSENFLRVMDSRLAAGDGAIQGLYQVENVGESWRTRLMTCALALAHYVKPMGRMAFGLSDGLKGNGMCFSREVLSRIPWSGESITEDIEYTLRLVQAGVRIAFAPEAVVRAQMPTSGRQAATQRQRWEGGRYALLRRALGLLGKSLRAGRPMVADRAVELIIPPFVELFALPAVCLIAGAAWLFWSPTSFAAVLWMAAWAAVTLAGLCYLVAGLILARVPWSVSSALLFAPVYALWKLGVYGTMILRRAPSGWVRTERHERAG
jgi:cellulose synthase/poly-beta-1,6-N-acetylglucosamine synthase-like glycosyltransferase